MPTMLFLELNLHAFQANRRMFIVEYCDKQRGSRCINMFKNLEFRCVIILIFTILRLATAMGQERLLRKLDDLDLKIQKENILRREEINTLYAKLDRIDERLNNTLPKPPIDDLSNERDQLTLDDVSMKEVLNKFRYLIKGFKDEKKLASRLRRHVTQLNNTMHQMIYQVNNNMEQLLSTVGDMQYTLLETRNNSKALTTGQNELKTSIVALHKDLQRHDSETRAILMKEDNNCAKIPDLFDKFRNLEIRVKNIRSPVFATSCLEHKKTGNIQSGVYQVLSNGDPFMVYCDQDTEGGGWTVFQRRKDGSVDFARTLDDYKAGFGNLDGEFWSGNKNLHRLLSLSDINELRIDMVYNDNTKTYAKYGKFMVGSEDQKYVLTVGNYSGTTWVDTFGLCNGWEFSIHKHWYWLLENAWWFFSSSECNLNGYYFTGEIFGSMRWSRADDKHSRLKFVEMKFRETVQK